MTTEELIAARRAEPWREALRKSKKNKERTDIPRVEMNELDAEYRSHTRLEEVNLGLTKEQAMQEAQRCLDCRPCMPAGKAVREQMYSSEDG